MKPKKENKPHHSTGLIFVRWNIWSRVCVGVAFFYNGKMVDYRYDKSLIRKLVRNFVKDSSYDFIHFGINAYFINPEIVTESFWNDQANQQNGIIEIRPTSGCAIDQWTDKHKDSYADIFIKTEKKV